jgi:DNA-binding CsgD family transcriptional regulator
LLHHTGHFSLPLPFPAPKAAVPTHRIGVTFDWPDASAQSVTCLAEAPISCELLQRELPLTGREKQLCLRLAHDKSRQDLADAMGVSAGTIVTHQTNIYAKLGVHSRAGLPALLPT